MDNTALIELLHNELGALNSDIRVESLLSLAVDKGLVPDDFMIACEGLFVREFSKDLLDQELKEDARKKQFLELHISRAGIFDQLPEGLFFQQPERRSARLAAGDMAADHKANKKKEAEIRRFFRPFENDFFWQRLQLESEERKALEGMQSGMLNDYFIDFWQMPHSVSREFTIPIILLLPYAHQIAGDIHLMPECLEQILLEQVTLRKKNSEYIHSEKSIQSSLGESALGVDMICGEQFMVEYPVFEFVIGPLQRSAVSDYLEGGSRFQVLDIFSRFFVPAGLDIEFEIRIPEDKRSMKMEKGAGPVLGYSSVL